LKKFRERLVRPGDVWSNFLRFKKMGEFFHVYGMAAAKSVMSVDTRLSSFAKSSDSPME
jgi:hypothetical protein